MRRGFRRRASGRPTPRFTATRTYLGVSFAPASRSTLAISSLAVGGRMEELMGAVPEQGEQDDPCSQRDCEAFHVVFPGRSAGILGRCRPILPRWIRGPIGWITRRSLYEGRLFEAGYVACRPTPDLRHEVEYPSLNVLALPIAGVFALHEGPRRELLATPNHAVFISSRRPIQGDFPRERGRRLPHDAAHPGGARPAGAAGDATRRLRRLHPRDPGGASARRHPGAGACSRGASCRARPIRCWSRSSASNSWIAPSVPSIGLTRRRAGT
jgi:hypothetical protein